MHANASCSQVKDDEGGGVKIGGSLNIVLNDECTRVGTGRGGG